MYVSGYVIIFFLINVKKLQNEFACRATKLLALQLRTQWS